MFKEAARPIRGPRRARQGLAQVDTNGWINVHLEGTPREIGFQHGWLLAPEIDDLLKALRHFLEGSTKRDWAFFRSAAERMFWPKLEAEYQEEIDGIVEGLKARLPRTKYDRVDLSVLNGWIELAWYYVPYLDEMAKKGAGDNKAPGYCSAFIADGELDGRRRHRHRPQQLGRLHHRIALERHRRHRAGGRPPHPHGLLSREPSTAATTSS